MAESKATIVIDGNTEQITKKFEDTFSRVGKKASDTFKKTAVGAADEIAKAGDKAGQSMEKSFDKSINVLAKGTVIIAAIAAGISAAAEKAQELVQTYATLNQKRGGVHLEASQAAARGGFNQASVSSFISQISPVSQEARAGLIDALASTGQSIDNRRLNELTSAFGSGAFSQSEVVNAANSGDQLDVQGRLAQMSPEARREIEVRRALDSIEATTRDKGNAAARLGAELASARDINSPDLSYKRSIAESFDKTGLGKASAAVKNATDASDIYLKEIANNTRGKLNMSGAQDSQ